GARRGIRRGHRMTPRGPLAFVLRLAFIAAILGVWELVIAGLQTPEFLVPAPSKIAYALYNGFARNLYPEHVKATLVATLVGFAAGCALAVALGVVVALSRTTEYYIYPIVVMFQALPKVALIPIFLTWFGIGITSKIIGAALVAFFPLMVNII